MAGLGIGWFEREHDLYGWDFPSRSRRYDLLEDALQLLPLLWGKGSPRFEGRTVTVPEAICYPRPLQDHVPILVGGSGERRTLRLVARYADACNLFGDAATVRHKIEVLHRHCADVDRDPAEVTVTNLTTAQVIDAGDERPADHAGTTRRADRPLPRLRRGRRADGDRVARRRRRGRHRAIRSGDRRLPVVTRRPRVPAGPFRHLAPFGR